MANPGNANSTAATTAQDLDALLQVVNNSVTITSGTLPGGVIGDVLDAFNGGNPLQIAQAAKSVKTDGVTLAGTTSFLGEANVAISATFVPNGDFTLSVDCPGTSLAEFLAPVKTLQLPKGFDVALPETWVIISRSSGTLTIVAAAKGTLGEVAIQGTKDSSGWGVTAGIELAATNLSSFSALKPLAAFDDFVGLTDIMLVVSSVAAPSFDFPDTDQFQVPALGSGKIKLPDEASGLAKGLNLYANLSTAKSKPFQLLANFLKIKLDGSVGITLSISLPDPEQSSKLFISFTENDIIKGLSMTGTAGGVLQDGQVGAMLTGTATAPIQGQPVVFNVTVVAVESGILITGSMQNTAPIQFTIDGVQFSIANVGLLIGIDDDGIPSLGFAATVDVGKFNASAAVFIDSVTPQQSMFAAAISGLSLWDVASSIAGQKNIPAGVQKALKKIGLANLQAFNVPKSYAKPLIKALDNRDLPTIAGFFNQRGGVTIPKTSDQILLDINTKSSLWYLTDLSTMNHYALQAGADGAVAVSLEPQLYCVPQDTAIGSLNFPKGFHVYGELDLYVTKAKVKIAVQGLTGVCADVNVDQITIVNPTFFALTDATGKKGPQVSIATFAQNAKAQPDKNFQPPHIFISGKLRVLGVDLTSTYLSVSEKGVVVDITQPVYEGLTLTLKGNIGDPDNMSLGGAAVVGVNAKLDLGKLGSVRFNDNVNGSLTLGVTKGNAYASVVGGFAFTPFKNLQTASVKLNVNTKALASLATTLVPYIATTVANALKGDVTKWLGLVKDGTIQGIKGAKQIAGVLSSEYKLSAGETSKLLSKSGYEAGEIAGVLKSVYGLSAKDAAGTLKQALGVSNKAMAAALQGGGYGVREVAGVVSDAASTAKKATDTVTKGVSDAAKEAGDTVNKAENALKKAFKL